MKSISRFLKPMSMALVILASVVGCGKNDGGGNNDDRDDHRYAYVNSNGYNQCVDIDDHRAVDQSKCNGSSSSFTWNGSQCMKNNGTVVSSSYCNVTNSNQYGNNGQYGNGGICYDQYNRQVQCGTTGSNPYGQTTGNSCQGTYYYYNYAYFQAVECYGYNCAGYQLYDLNGRLVSCQ